MSLFALRKSSSWFFTFCTATTRTCWKVIQNTLSQTELLRKACCCSCGVADWSFVRFLVIFLSVEHVSSVSAVCPEGEGKRGGRKPELEHHGRASPMRHAALTEPGALLQALFSPLALPRLFIHRLEMGRPDGNQTT